MILWINGAFGAGKTQTAFELHRRIVDSFVYDPENVGYFMWKNLPPSFKKGDFQNFPLWREVNLSMLKAAVSAYNGILIVPMTIVNPQYFDEIVGELRKDGADIRHFALMASKDTLLRRLKSRGDGANCWAAKQIDRCLEALPDERFAQQIDTEDKSVEAVAEEIARLAGVLLLPPDKSLLKRAKNRLMTTLKHIRLFSWRI